MERHFEVKGDNDFELVMYRDWALDDFEQILDTAAGMLMNATESVHDFYKSEEKEHLKELSDKLAAVRKERDG